MSSIKAKELLLFYITVQGFISYIPQIIKLIKRKSADDIALSTYIIRAINSTLYLLYIVLDNCGVFLIISQALEVMLIGITTVVACVISLIGHQKNGNKHCV